MVHVVDGTPSISVSMRRNQVAMTLACLVLAGLVPEEVTGGDSEAPANRKRGRAPDGGDAGTGEATAQVPTSDVDMGGPAEGEGPAAAATDVPQQTQPKRPRVGGEGGDM